MQKFALTLIGLLAANHQLSVFGGDVEIFEGKSGDSKGDSQAFAILAAKPLDIVRRISVS